MTGAVVMAYNPGQVIDGAQVTVVTGTDFAINPPAPPTPTTAPGASAHTSSPSTAAPVPTTTPTTVPVSTSEASGALAAPSPSTSNLEPWDPRACPAGAIPTVPVVNEIG
jgi:hypothetical protein